MNGHLETGGGKAACVTGRLYAAPGLGVVLRHPSRHWAKVGFERTLLWRWF